MVNPRDTMNSGVAERFFGGCKGVLGTKKNLKSERSEQAKIFDILTLKIKGQLCKTDFKIEKNNENMQLSNFASESSELAQIS